MMQFKAFKPSGMEKIARSMGYQGDMQGFQNFLANDPAKQQQMDRYTNSARMMARGGVVNMQSGGTATSGKGGNVGTTDSKGVGTSNDGKLGYSGFDNFSGDAGGPSGRPRFYTVFKPGQGGDSGEIIRIRVGSKQDTSDARKRASSGQTAPNPTDNLSAFAGTKPYDVRLAEYMASLPQDDTTPVSDPPAPEGPSDPTSLYSDQLADDMANTPVPFGTSFSPNANPPIYGTAFTDNQGQTFINPNTPNVQRIVAGQPTQQNVGQMPGLGPRGPFGMPLPSGAPPRDNPNTPQNEYQDFINRGISGQGPLRFKTGGVVTNPDGTQAGTPTVTEPSVPAEGEPAIGQFTVEQMYQPGVPIGGTTIAATTPYDQSQDIAAGTGTLTGTYDLPTEEAGTFQAADPTAMQANLMQADTVSGEVDAALSSTQAAQSDPNDPRLQIQAAQQTQSSVGNLQAAQGNAFLINNPVQRQIQDGELISGTGVDAAKAAALTAQTQAAAASANPSQQAMVQGQLSNLMQDFDGANPPSWAAGAMRAATAAMAARGLGSSSLAGQAVVQAAMESALPIAQADAQTIAKFESQNLSNRQQSAMLAAEQRARFLGQEFDQAFQAKVMNASKISDIANQNFTAEQQVQLENSRAANTMNLQNLSNSQALVMAEASALAQLDVANLNNRQQAAVQNAQNFLQVDMANLSNQQQTELFKAQQRVQSLFTDQAATNAAAQFNASSQNQVDQFFANLSSQVAQFNATQQNAQSQFNAGQTNTIARFNAELNNQRDQFNASNQIVIAQANAQWRRQIATADTAAVTRANELHANAILGIRKTGYDNLWNYYADTMEWAWTSAENQIDRNNALAIAELDAKTRSDVAKEGSSSAAGSAVGSLIGTLGSAWILSGCWVAREVYGQEDIRWFIFRSWLQYKSPKWFKKLYMTHGEKYAKLISKIPPLKWATRKLMDFVVETNKGRLDVQTV